MPKYDVFVTVALIVEADSAEDAESEAFINWREGDIIEIEVEELYEGE